MEDDSINKTSYIDDKTGIPVPSASAIRDGLENEPKNKVAKINPMISLECSHMP